MPTVVDSSAIVALFKSEPEAEALWAHVRGGVELFLPVSCYLESVMVLSRYRGSRRWLDTLTVRYDVVLLTCDPSQARLAADAFERYGRGSGHPAKLNFGDCLSYAAAASLGAPLLFKGADFALTDVRSALAAS